MKFVQAYNQVLRKMGYPADWGGSADQEEEVAEMITFALKLVWEHAMWSRLMVIGEVAVVEADGMKSALWPEGPHVEAVWPMHPYKQRVSELVFQLRPGVMVFPVGGRLGDNVYVEYRPRHPVFTRVAYDGATTYGVGDVVFDVGSGECYRSLAAGNVGNAVTSGAHWEPQLLPVWMEYFVIFRAFAELLRNDGRGERADVEENRAQGILEDLLLKEESQQAQRRDWTITAPR